MFFPILLGFFTAFFALAFPLLHLLASLSELRKGRNPLGNRLLLIGSSLATLSIFLYFFLSIVALSLWLIGCGLICYGAYWNDKQKGTFKNHQNYMCYSSDTYTTFILIQKNLSYLKSKMGFLLV